jgi:hypothetical protein
VTPVEEMTQRLRSPEFADVSAKYLMAEAAALIERLAGALEPFAKHADRVATLGLTETDPLPAWLKDCQAARRALSGKD